MTHSVVATTTSRKSNSGARTTAAKGNVRQGVDQSLARPAAGKARKSHLGDVALTLEEAKAMWLLGDWHRLSESPVRCFGSSADRQFIALLVGSACLQLGQNERGRRLVAKAKRWGCPSGLIGRLLVAGAYFSLGRAELLSQDRMNSRRHLLAGMQAVAGTSRPDLHSVGNDRHTENLRAGIAEVSPAQLAELLRSELPPPVPSESPLHEWQMARDDGPILRYLLAAHRSRRHLEFGTWQGWGTRLCLEATEATVWTINLPDGETKPDGEWAYAERVDDLAHAPPGAVSVTYGDQLTGPIVYHRTDAASYVGHLYREQGLGHRVCQIYCDSRDWDTSAYPGDFFDSVFVDGGHQTDVVISDTRKALSVLRPGGLIIWHDFCPVPAIQHGNPVTEEVTGILESLLPEIDFLFSTLVWVNPSMILFGIKK